MKPRTALAIMTVVGLVLHAAPAEPIVGGTVDTSFECVGSLHSTTLGFHCTGTLIHESWVLTSAACALAGPNLFAMGADWTAAPRVYAVDHAALHPSYDGNRFDLALLHLATPAAGEPVCAPATSPDGMYAAMPFTTVGYGLISYPSGTTTARHRGDNTLSDLGALQFSYLYDSSLPCIGDHGGPNLANVNMSIAVVGVVSVMDEGCSQLAVSTRVAPFYPWIVETIGSWPGIFLDGFETGDTVLWSATSP